PGPLPGAAGRRSRSLLHSTGARDGVLIVRHYDPAGHPAENCRAYDAAGRPLDVPLVPFARSIAATAVSLQEPCAMTRPDQAAASGTVELQPFAKGRASLLAAPLAVAPGVHVVLELFDKQGAAGKEGAAFTDEDQRLVRAAADFGAELLRHALSQRQTHQVLLDAVAAALGASDSVSQSLRGSAAERLEQPPPVAVVDPPRGGPRPPPGGRVGADETLRLAEAVRVLALRHGPPAVQHCTRLVEGLRELLDQLTGADLKA